MDSGDLRQALASLLLLIGSVFFVAAEYGLVSARRSRIDALAKRGNASAKRLGKELEDLSPYVAAGQIAITMIGIGVGSVTEPFVTEKLRLAFGAGVNPAVSYGISFVLVSFVLVVVGELVPKYWALRAPEKVALGSFRVLRFVRVLLTPLVWLAQGSAAFVLKPFGIRPGEGQGDSVPKEELLLLVQSGGVEGTLDKMHADMVSRALRLDVLAARDIMVHRLDVKWLDAGLSASETKRKLRDIPYSRIPVCRGDIDDLVGIAYLHDLVKSLDRPDFSLEKVMREAVIIPESLSVEKIVSTMREQKTQILIVMDEYGGTSGLITLEDVVEEIFGELEDRIESERPQIEVHGARVSARADVRFDELVSRLGLPLETEDNTDTLAQLIVDGLERVPRPGDSIPSSLGVLRVENMARQRVTRVSIILKPEFLEASENPS